MPAAARSERTLVFLIGLVQFVNILDFLIVMPLGPDFAKALGIPTSHLGYVGGSYTAAAAVSGFIGSFFLDRFDRGRALSVALLGLVIGTAAAGFATGLSSLMAARLIAGTFGGPATSLAFSILADVIPPERRGKAMGAVMAAFSVATVVGVPLGLELSRLGGWQLPFWFVACLGLLVTAGVAYLLPPLRGHMDQPQTGGFLDLFRRPVVPLSYSLTAVVMMAGFLLIPNISAYVQYNLAYPRDRLWILYFVGGLVSFAVVRAAGGLVDRFGSFRIGTLGALLLSLVLYFGFAAHVPWVPTLAIIVGFMAAMGLRNVAYNTLTSKVPRAHERARFLSLQSTIQHVASACGAFLSARVLEVRPDQSLVGIPTIATVSIALLLAAPGLFWTVESRVGAGKSAGI